MDTTTTHPPEPTYDQVNQRERFAWEGKPCQALWYPSMGGHCGKAVAVVDNHCFDVYVWHDGDFPFADDERNPRKIHHCTPDEFAQFGDELNRFGDSVEEGAKG